MWLLPREKSSRQYVLELSNLLYLCQEGNKWTVVIWNSYLLHSAIYYSRDIGIFQIPTADLRIYDVYRGKNNNLL